MPNVLTHLFEDEFYFDRKEVPKDLKGRQDWSWEGRKVRKDARPDAVLRVQIDGTDRWQHLFRVKKTDPFKQPFAVAFRAFARLFCGPAYRRDYIYRYQARDEKGWRHSSELLTLSKIQQHVLGKRILGSIGHWSTNHLIFDIDYHAKDTRRELFLARCQAFHQELPKFFSSPGSPPASPRTSAASTSPSWSTRCPCAGPGVRPALSGDAGPEVPDPCRRRELHQDRGLPGGQGGGRRDGLPTAASQGRVCFTDRLLDGDPRSNCVNLVKWIYDWDRKNVEKTAFLGFLRRTRPNTKPHPLTRRSRQSARSQRVPAWGASAGLRGGACGRCSTSGVVKSSRRRTPSASTRW